MGYNVSTMDVCFTIPAENVDQAYAEMCRANDHFTERFPSFNIFDQEQCSNAIEAFRNIGFDADTDITGDIIVYGFDGKSKNEEKIFEAIAPYVEPNSYIEWRGENGEMWRNVFENGRMITQNGEIVWK